MIQNYKYQNSYNEISLSNILVTFAEQLKVIAFCFFVSVFISFTYNWSKNEIFFESKSKILLPLESGTSGGMGGLASQFGVSLGQDSSPADLSSPVLFPEIIKTHSFTEKF